MCLSKSGPELGALRGRSSRTQQPLLTVVQDFGTQQRIMVSRLLGQQQEDGGFRWRAMRTLSACSSAFARCWCDRQIHEPVATPAALRSGACLQPREAD